MKLDKYLDDFYINLIYESYDEDYINNICNNYDIDKNIEILKKYGFNNLEDILLNDINILIIEPNKLEKRLSVLKDIIGDNYVDTINDNIELLDKLILRND